MSNYSSRNRSSFRLSGKFLSLLSITLISLCGCGEEKESSHEHSHDEPPHWPANLGEAASFIDNRIQALVDNGTTMSDSKRTETIEELRDLVEWSPEIVADTDLTESDWIPVYELSESIRKHMLAGDVGPATYASDFEKLTGLLLEAESKVSEVETQRMQAMGTLGAPQEQSEESKPESAETDSTGDHSETEE